MQRSLVNETGQNGNKREIKTKYNRNDLNRNNQITPYGFDSVPLKGAEAIRGTTGRTNVVLGYIQKAIEGMNEGESVVFSKASDGSISATIKMRGDETIELLGNNDNLVRFSDLKSEFNKLQSDFNTHIATYNALVTAYNAHVHPVPAAAALVPPPAPTPVSLITPASGSPSTPNNSIIDNAKHEGLKTNSK